MDLSIIIPVFNEADNVEDLCGKLRAALGAIGKSYEIILVDDGSADGTWAKLVVEASSMPQLRSWISTPARSYLRQRKARVWFIPKTRKT